MFKNILLKTTFIMTALFVTSACTMSLEQFGKQASGALDNPSESAVKGTYPLGQPAFLGSYKSFFAAAPGNKFVAIAPFDLKAYIFASDGKVLKTIILSTAAWANYTISGLGVDGAGNIFIAIDDNTAARRQYIRKFDINGNDLGIWKEFSQQSGMFPTPKTMVFDGSNNVYLGMTYWEQVQKYDSSANLLQSYGVASDDAAYNSANDGNIHALQSFAVDSGGNVYTVDEWSDRLQKFKPDGTFDSKVTWPRQIAMSVVSHLLLLSNGNFALTESMGNATNLDIFDSTGTLLHTDDGTGGGQTAFTGSISDITEAGTDLYLVNSSETRVYDKTTAAFATKYTPSLTAPIGVARDKNQNTYVSTTTEIKRFDPTGYNDLSIPSGGAVFYSLATDSAGNVYGSDLMTGTVFKYKPDGTADGSYTVPGGAAFSFAGIAIDKNDIIYIAGYSAGVVYKMTTSFVQLGTIGSGVISNPLGVAVASDGSVFVTDMDMGTNAFLALRKITPANTIAWSVLPGAAGNLTLGYFLAVDSNDNVYVTDAVGNQVVKYDTSGALVTSFGSAGGALGQFAQPIGISVDKFGYIYVVDNQNNRVQKFDSTGAAQTE